jgi:hypothetical protein
MNAPQHLSHKPIIAVNNYDKIDGIYSSDSDAKALSIGEAQYDPSQISLKVWRHTGEMWSRQSEELPLHRVIDLCRLLISSINPNTGSKTSLNEEIVYPGMVKDIEQYYADNKPILDSKLKELKMLINDLDI